MKKKSLLLILAVTLTVGVGLLGCSSSKNDKENTTNTTTTTNNNVNINTESNSGEKEELSDSLSFLENKKFNMEAKYEPHYGDTKAKHLVLSNSPEGFGEDDYCNGINSIGLTEKTCAIGQDAIPSYTYTKTMISSDDFKSFYKITDEDLKILGIDKNASIRLTTLNKGDDTTDTFARIYEVSGRDKLLIEENNSFHNLTGFVECNE